MEGDPFLSLSIGEFPQLLVSIPYFPLRQASLCSAGRLWWEPVVASVLNPPGWSKLKAAIQDPLKRLFKWQNLLQTQPEVQERELRQ